MLGKNSAKTLARSGVIAALYVVTSLLLFPFTFGIFQFRLSEALTILPLFFAESVPALFIGCLITNIFSSAGAPDIIIGSLATLIAALCTYFAGKAIKNKFARFFVGIIFPVVINAFAIPIVFILSGTNEYAYMIEVLILGAEELVSVAIFGGALYFGCYKLFTKKKAEISKTENPQSENKQSAKRKSADD